MASKVQNKNTYKNKVKLDLERINKNDVNNINTYLTKIAMKSQATDIGTLSQDVKLFMILPSSNRHYAPNDRTISLLMKGQIDENAVTGGGR